MATKIVLNTPRFKGEYALDLEQAPTALEWRWIKKTSGYLPLTWEEGIRGGDPDLIVALAVIALVRAGKVSKTDALATADWLAEAVPFDGESITLIGDEEEEAEDGGPPAEPATPATVQPLRSTGESSRSTLESQEPNLAATGALS